MDAERPNTFQILLARLDSNQETAADKYLTLHLKLSKTLIYNGCRESDAESVADEILDRVAQKIITIEAKLAQGITKEKGKEIKPIESITAYSLTVLRFVLLEYFRKYPLPPDDDPPETGTEDDWLDLGEPDLRLRCMRKCIAEKIPKHEDKELFLGYYGYKLVKLGEKKKEQAPPQNEPVDKNPESDQKTKNEDKTDKKLKEIRAELASKRGISKGFLKKKVCELRHRVEFCIRECLKRLNKQPGRSGEKG